MFLSLGDLPQQTNWRKIVEPVKAAFDSGDLQAVGSLSDKIATTSSGSIPVITIARDVVKAVANNDDVAAAVKALLAVAELEDVASEVDRNLSGQLILQQIGQLNTNIAAFMAKHSGLYALWDKVKGGADITPLTNEAKQVQRAIDTTPLTSLGRQQLNARLLQSVATIKPEVDWGTIGVAVGTLALVAGVKWGLGKAQALAAEHVQERASQTALGQRLGIKTAKKKKKAKRT